MDKRQTVMIIEDDQDLRENMRDVLQGEGYQTLEADNGLAALDLLKSLAPNARPACILLDLMMPVMDGKTFVEELSRCEERDLAKIAIILTTARGAWNQELPKLPLVTETLRKPMDIDQLIGAVHRQIGRA